MIWIIVGILALAVILTEVCSKCGRCGSYYGAGVRCNCDPDHDGQAIDDKDRH